MGSHRKQLSISGGLLVAVVICVQLIYPADSLLPFATIDSVDVGGMKKTMAIKQLEARVNETKIPILITEDTEPYAKVLPSDIGLTVEYEKKIEAAGYPLWARLIPASIVWFHSTIPDDAPSYIQNDKQLKKFIDESLGGCDVQPKNATLQYKNKSLAVIPAKDGGRCDAAEVETTLKDLKPTISSPAIAKLDVQVTKPKIPDEQAVALKQSIEQRIDDGVTIRVNDSTEIIPSQEIYSWLDFEVEKSDLVYKVNAERSDKFFQKTIAQYVAVPAGTTKVATRDFTELSRQVGSTGLALDGDRTRQSIERVISGKSQTAVATTKIVKPKVEYSRSYTKTSIGISALVSQYGQDHPGEFGISFQELEGTKRIANYSGYQSFITASTYKLFVAYGTLKKIEANDWKWTDDVVDDRNLSTCFDDMIVKSDNSCAEALYKKIGYQNVIDDVRRLGLSNTTLSAGEQRTTADDLRIFLVKLQDGSIGLKDSSRDRLISAMKGNEYRLGIPSGASGDVADKVGFLDGLLHDAAIVYSPKGTYVLTIMSDGSTWANLADLAKKIESLR